VARGNDIPVDRLTLSSVTPPDNLLASTAMFKSISLSLLLSLCSAEQVEPVPSCANQNCPNGSECVVMPDRDRAECLPLCKAMICDDAEDRCSNVADPIEEHPQSLWHCVPDERLHAVLGDDYAE
jgi:hypothetical protein